MGIDGIVTILSCFNAVDIGPFLTANETGIPPSPALSEAAGANPAPAGNELTPACTTCCMKGKKKANRKLLNYNKSGNLIVAHICCAISWDW